MSSKILKNIKLMLKDRGYSCKREGDLTLGQDCETIWSNSSDKLVLVILVESDQLKKNTLSNLLVKYLNTVQSMVIVSKEREASAITNIINRASIPIQCIQYRFFHVNVPRHVNQPKISLRDYGELTMYGEKESFPKVLMTDSIVVYYGFRKGDVVEYQRESEVYWRVVVA